ncbi:MAG: hypothetical protein WCT04_06325 [Planctomycetota bacterium]
MSYNPNRKPFPRGVFLDRFSGARIHPLERRKYERYFENLNQDGYQHDLGAQDVFLDNFGLLAVEQLKPVGSPLWNEYFRTIHYLLLRWELLKHHVFQFKPWWGKNFNIKTRKANAGEPRSLLRFWDDVDLSRIEFKDFDFIDDHSNGGRQAEYPDTVLDAERTRGVFYPDRRKGLIDDLFARLESQRLISHREWSATDFVPEDYSDAPIGGHESSKKAVLGGVPLPPGFPPVVEALKLLSPKHATPDLPTRVGNSATDLAIYRRVIRDQGQFGTCTSHAVSVGLDVLAQRQRGHRGKERFSPAWLHFSTGTAPEGGRALSVVIDTLRTQMPCDENALPYREHIRHYASSGVIHPNWKTTAAAHSAQANTQKYGLPSIRKLDPQNISQIKTYLAAGWIVIVSTAFTNELRSPGFEDLGLPLTPLPGHTRGGGHCWLLVGYDHVDGQMQWKYQGRFLTLNSWGNDWPNKPAYAPGICGLPFAMLLTECFEAYALRFPDSTAGMTQS